MKHLWLIGIILLALNTQAKTVKAAYVTDKAPAIKLDGKLDEAVWQQAKPQSGFQFPAARAQSRSFAQTDFRLIAAPNGIYIGITCQEPQMAKIKPEEPQTRNLTRVFEREHIEIFISPENNSNCFYQFAVSIDNSQWNQYFIEGGTAQMEIYNALWQSEVFRGADFWSVEVYIPYSAFYHTAANVWQNQWMFNVTRNRSLGQLREITSWSKLERKFTEPGNFNIITGMPLKSPETDLNISMVKFSPEKQSDGVMTGPLQITLTSGVARPDAEFKFGEPFNRTFKQAIRQGLNEFSISGIALPVSFDGRPFPLKIEAFAKDGQCIGGRYYDLIAKYEPCRITISEPFYRNTYFPDETPGKITGSVQLQLPDGAKVKLSLDGAGLKSEQELTVQNRQIEFSFDASAMTYGSATLTVEGSLKAQAQVHRLTPPVNSSYARIDKYGRYIRNGKPFLFLGWRGAPDYLVSQKLLEKYPKAQDRCSVINSAGAEIWLSEDKLLPAERERAQRGEYPSPEFIEKLKAKVLENRDRDIMGYLVGHEPECRGISPEFLKHCYQLVKELDPYHPVICATRSPERYIDTADLFRVHPYLDPMVNAKGQRQMKSPLLIKNVCQEVIQAGHDRKALWVTLGTFAYNFLNIYSVPPTFEEANCMFWLSVANGARGFYTYIYYQSFETQELKEGTDFIYYSLDRLRDYLMTTEPNLPIQVTGDGVDAAIKTHDGKIMAVAVNLLPQPNKITLSSDAFKKYPQLLEFRGSRTFKPSNNSLSIDLKPYEAIVMTDTQEDQNLSGITALRAQINQWNEARKNSKNILLGKNREIEYNTSNNLAASSSGGTIMLKSLLTDGESDAIAWLAKNTKESWIEAIFTGFTPEFNRIVLHGYPLAQVQLYSWERGQYHPLKPDDVKAEKYRVEMAFKEKQEVVKLKIVFPQSKHRAELYELEMY